MVLLTPASSRGRACYVRRVAEMRAKRRIHPQAVATARDMAARSTTIARRTTFRNLFETPVLFYAAMLTGCRDHARRARGYVALAWLYVALRYAHSVHPVHVQHA